MTACLRPSAWLAMALLALFAPLLLLLSLLVLVGLGRPVLFRQVRSGLGGQPFAMIKFRSMRDLRDSRGDLLPDAQRTPALGRFLRRSRLDELPELINIVRGDMDFVGPRPLLPRSIAAMGRDGVERGKVRPGLTGLAQVSGNTLLAVEEKLRFDLWYVRHHSARLDAQIIARTLLVVVGGEKRIDWHADEARPPHWGG
jgi:lipopolysaccharide/colanic/teichoic acid biosynthesis glycosyltransferase